MRKALLNTHKDGGSPEEAARFQPILPDHAVPGMTDTARTPQAVRDDPLIRTLQIRPITEAEDAAAARLVQDNLRQAGLDIPGTAYYDPELLHLSRFYNEKPTQRAYFVALNPDGRVLGGAGLAEFDGLPACAELQKLYLADSAKRQGLGTHLVQKIEQHARMLGYRQLYLETHSALTAACRLYEKLGFSEIPRPACVQHGTMNRFYCKEL